MLPRLPLQHEQDQQIPIWQGVTLRENVCNLLTFGGGSACIVTVFPLGLDQMPDAYSVEIVAYIKSIFLTITLGFWTGSLFIFGQKWLIIEPKSSRSLKNIFRVLKFAAKHKAPLNRSAFTYWEEDIPSRLDLGKSKYGGPLTTEQVEDVKTFLRLLIVFLPVYIAIFSVNTTYGAITLLHYPLEVDQLYNSSCVYSLFSKFTYSPWWCATIVVVLYKLVIHRILIRCIPSTLKRIGGLILLLALFEIAFSTYSLITINSPNQPWSPIAYTILSSSSYALFVLFSIEFVCAQDQSPYHMRSLLSGITFFSVWLFLALGYIVSLMFSELCSSSQACKISQLVLGATLGAVAFLLHLVVAGWYRLRVRNEDEEYNAYWQITVKLWVVDQKSSESAACTRAFEQF